MRFHPLFTLSSLLAFALADVEFKSPAAGSSFVGGGSIQVEWKDSGTAPALADLTTYQLFLCAGGDDAASMIQLMAITTKGDFSVGNNAEGTIPAAIGGSTKNAYFLKMISVAAAGGTVINYSSRFTMTGMEGVFPDSVVTGLKTVSGTDGPPTKNNVAKAGAATATATVASGSFALPWTMQTGAFRYAAMQTYPGTKITKKTKVPLNPTSPYKVATTYLPPAATIQSTVTAQVTWSFSQIENTVDAAAMPTDDMQRFLARWKD